MQGPHPAGPPAAAVAGSAQLQHGHFLMLAPRLAGAEPGCWENDIYIIFPTPRLYIYIAYEAGGREGRDRIYRSAAHRRHFTSRPLHTTTLRVISTPLRLLTASHRHHLTSLHAQGTSTSSPLERLSSQFRTWPAPPRSVPSHPPLPPPPHAPRLAQPLPRPPPPPPATWLHAAPRWQPPAGPAPAWHAA